MVEKLHPSLGNLSLFYRGEKVFKSVIFD